MAIKRKRIVELLMEGCSQSEVCAALHCSKRDVSKLAKLVKDNGIDAEALAELTEDDLRQLVLPKTESEDNYIKPDLDYIGRELKKTGVTRKLLWYEYINTTEQAGMEHYQYSQFCKLIEKHLNITGATMTLKHKPGRCLFVDWAGDTMAVRDKVTGKDLKVYIFVSCLPYSGYTYAEGFFDITQRSWLSAHERAFEYMDGVSYIIVPDQCATATDRAPIYVTVVNSTYLSFAEHYNTAVVPTRRKAPTDKAAVEGSVGIVEKWVCAALRNETFFSLDDLNEAVWEKLEWINNRPFTNRDGSRSSVFEAEEKEELKALVPERFEQFTWKKPVVSHDYHVQIDYMRYSLDYRLIKETVDAKITDSRIDLYHKGKLVASHKRLYGRKGQFSTLKEHMPPNHRHFDSSWSPEGFTKWASRIGPNALIVIEGVLKSRPIVEQTFVSCANILGLAKKGKSELLEAACAKIAHDSAYASYTRVKNIMAAISKANDCMPEEDESKPADEDAFDGIGRTRGSDYYRRGEEGQ